MQIDRATPSGWKKHVQKIDGASVASIELKGRAKAKFIDLSKRTNMTEAHKIFEFGRYIYEDEGLTRPGGIIMNGSIFPDYTDPSVQYSPSKMRPITSLDKLLSLSKKEFSDMKNCGKDTAHLLVDIFDYIKNSNENLLRS